MRLRRFFIRQFRHRADASDATQETFLRFLDALTKTLIENPQAYLFQIARSVACQASRRAAIEASLLVGDADPLAVAEDRPGPERVADIRQTLRRWQDDPGHPQLSLVSAVPEPTGGRPARCDRTGRSPAARR